MSHFEIDSAAQSQADARERLERIAVRCLQGLLAADIESTWAEENVAAIAVRLAGALIAELDKESKHD